MEARGERRRQRGSDRGLARRPQDTHETGDGAERAFIDAQADFIIRYTLAPAFREGQYGKGLHQASVEVLSALGVSPEVPAPPRASSPAPAAVSPAPAAVSPAPSWWSGLPFEVQSAMTIVLVLGILLAWGWLGSLPSRSRRRALYMMDDNEWSPLGFTPFDLGSRRSLMHNEFCMIGSDWEGGSSSSASSSDSTGDSGSAGGGGASGSW